jgi:hypothetical protein
MSPNRGPRQPFSYPGAPELMPQRPSGILRAQVNVAAAHPARDATSTAQVQPMSYSGARQAVAAAPPMQRMVPLLSRRMLIALGLLGLAVFAAVATIAIIRSAAGPGHSPAHGSAPTAPVLPSQPAPPSAQSSSQAPVRIPSTTQPPVSAPPTVTPIPTPPADRAAAQPPAAAATPSTASASPTASGPTARTAAADKTSAPAGTTGPSAAGAGATPPSAPTGPVAAAPPTSPAPAEPAHAAASDRTRAEPSPDRPHAEPARNTRAVKHTEPRKPEHKVEVAVAPQPRPRAHGRSLADVKSEANGLYRSKNFGGAAQAINAALSGFGGDDAKDLKSIAAIYSQLGKAYSVGMAPGTRPIEAYQNLLRALDYDSEVGKSYEKDLREALAVVAPRAATSFMASKSFEQAFQAVRKAEEFGSRSDSLKIVRQALEDKAKELLRAARSEIAADPEAAKQKLRQIQGMVERQNTIWQQASKLLTAP